MITVREKNIMGALMHFVTCEECGKEMRFFGAAPVFCRKCGEELYNYVALIDDRDERIDFHLHPGEATWLRKERRQATSGLPNFG